MPTVLPFFLPPYTPAPGGGPGPGPAAAGPGVPVPYCMVIRRRSVAPPPPPVPADPDLVAAVIARLRTTAVAGLFGDGATTRRFFSAPAAGSPQPPWLVISEPGETEQRDGIDGAGTTSYVVTGQLQVDVYGLGKRAVRDLRRAVISALNDAPLANDDAEVLYFASESPSSPPVEDVTVGSPEGYRATTFFRYILDRVY